MSTDALQKALDIRIAQGWQLGGNACPVLYTDTINGEQVCRDDLWLATTKGLKGAPTAKPITSALMIDDGGDVRVFCVMAAFRSEADAVAALAAITGGT